MLVLKLSQRAEKKVREGKNDRIKLKGSVRLRVERETLGKEVNSVRPGDCKLENQRVRQSGDPI